MATSRASSDDLRRYGEQLRGSFVPGNAHSQDHQPPADRVSHETPTHQPIRYITNASVTECSLLPGGRFGIGYQVLASEQKSPPPTSQPQPMQPGQRKPGTPIRPEDDQRRTHPPRRQGPGQQEQRPSPNRQVRPK